MSKLEGSEHLASVHDNPFVREYGRDVVLRHEVKDSRRSSTNSSVGNDSEQETEYGVNSGFVNKLRSKFAQLDNKSTTLSFSKRSASVENLLSIPTSNDYSARQRLRKGSGGAKSTDDANLPSSTSTSVELRKQNGTSSYRLQNRPNSSELFPQRTRPHSNELVSKSIEKPPLSKTQKHDFSKPNTIRSVKPPLPRKSSVDLGSKRNSRNSSTDSHSPRIKTEHHDWKVAPDLEKIGRDNIVIIESSSSTKVQTENKNKSEAPSDSVQFRKVKPVKEKASDENELPKPNTVSNFRSLFESTKKATDTIQAFRQTHSPTRKLSGSDTNSPRVLSPVSTPRSPLMRMNGDNVFENSTKYSSDKEFTNSSPRNSAGTEISIPQSHVSTADTLDEKLKVDTTPYSRKKSLEMFGKSDNGHHVDRSSPVGSRGSSSEPDIISNRPLSPSVQSTLTPMHSVSKVFDSKSVKPDKPKHAKPTILAKRMNIPKDTLELKHEADRMRSPSEENKSLPEKDIKHSVIIKVGGDEPNVPNDNVYEEASIKPSGRKSDNISPRKANIFDSSNMIKRKKPTPKRSVSVSPTENKEVNDLFNNIPEQVSVEIVDDNKDREVDMDISPVKPERKMAPAPPTSGVKQIKTNIVVNDTEIKSRSQKQPDFPKTMPFDKNERVNVRPSPKTIDNNETPVSGRSSFLTGRIKKSQEDQENLKTSSVHLANGSSPSPVPRKRQAPEKPLTNGSLDIEMLDEKVNAGPPPPLPVSAAPTLPTSSIDDVIKRKKKNAQSSTKMVFDSSKIVSKRKEPPKRKPPRKTLDELNQNITFESVTNSVPKLDLTSITADKQATTEYQEGYIPTVIKPCTIKFHGAEVTFKNSPYKRTKKQKANIKFDDHATTTFEYEGEEYALASYLDEHPEEREEAQRQDDEAEFGISLSGSTTESSDDLLNDSPRGPEQETSTMKSNTVIGMNAGGLINFKPKIQQPEFQFGMTPEPEEPVYIEEQEEQASEDQDLLPADDNDLDAFSAETGKADMLF